MTTAILLISEQTLPNVLFLKQFGPFDRHVFLTTTKMEEQGRSNWIIKAAGLDAASVHRLPIDPENATEGHAILEQQTWSLDTDYLINLTGGTKMMALAAFAFFAAKPRRRVVYLPINAPHFLELHPEPQEWPITARVTLQEYLDAYGVVLQNCSPDWQSRVSSAEEVMAAEQGKGDPEKVANIRTWMRNLQAEELTGTERRFYTGEWLEIWVAAQVQKMYNIPNDSIVVGAKLSRKNSRQALSYEYDVLFIYQNRLYTCECKYFHGQGLPYKKLREELFKYASVVVQFGLNAKAFFAIGNKTRSVNAELSERCKLLRLPYPATQDVLVDQQKFRTFIEKL